MKHIITVTLLVLLAFPLAAADKNQTWFGGPLFGNAFPAVEAQEGEDYNASTFTFGLWQRDADTSGVFGQPAPIAPSSKFLEYRDIPQGAVLPHFRTQGKSGNFRYDLIGRDVSQKDQRYFGLFEGKIWKFQINYTGIPHSFGNGGKSILIPVEENDKTEWRISDTLQESFQSSIEALPARNYETVLPIVQPTLDTQPSNIDIKLQRNRTNLAFSLLPAGGKFNIDVTYFNERRTGSRTNNGTSFGFNNVVETAEPIRYVSQDFGIQASTRNDWGVVFAGLHINDFSNKYDTFGWDNPFRAVDATSSQAYLGPYTQVEGPKTGLMSIWPSNEARTFNVGTNLFFGRRTRLSVDLQYGKWEQNEQSFIPYTTNTAIGTPSGEAAVDPSILPARHLDGQIDVVAFNGFFTSKVTDAFRVNARYRIYKNDNKTPRIRFEEGYVRFDAVWEEIPRISVPYGWDSGYFDLYGTYDIGDFVAFEVGYKYNRIKREYRETEETKEDTVRVAVDVRAPIGVLVRGLYETGSRDFDHYDAIEGEEHSFLAPEDPANQTVLRRYDQAKRDRERVGLQAQFTPESGLFSVSAAYYLNRDTYDDSPVSCQLEDFENASAEEFCVGGVQDPLGLLEAEYKTFTLDADVSPMRNLTVYAFFSREDAFDFQTGRQSGGTLVYDPASNWSSRVDNKVDTTGAGASFAFVPDTWFFDLFYRYQKVDGNNAFESGAAQRDPTNIPEYDDTEINFVSAQVRYNFAERWTLGVGSFWEKYVLEDSLTGAVLNYMPGSFFLNPNNGNYKAWVGWLNLTYRFSL